jgi:hypothetical protein
VLDAAEQAQQEAAQHLRKAFGEAAEDRYATARERADLGAGLTH